jgi:hypothetical protein
MRRSTIGLTVTVCGLLAATVMLPTACGLTEQATAPGGPTGVTVIQVAAPASSPDSIKDSTSAYATDTTKSFPFFGERMAKWCKERLFSLLCDQQAGRSDSILNNQDDDD